MSAKQKLCSRHFGPKKKTKGDNELLFSMVSMG